MKLTKGKIRKLYNKKKQTLKKKYGNKKKSQQKRTFRQKRSHNLAKKSLKKWKYGKKKGGDDDGDNPAEMNAILEAAVDSLKT